MVVKGLSGLTLNSVKKYPTVLPLYFLVGAAMILAGGASTRTLLKNPEVSINKKANPEPWNQYRDKQYKFFGVGRDYSSVESPAPKY